MNRVAIAGASGYVGGELLRLLLRHPDFEVTQITSERHRGQYVHTRHPHLRGQSTLRFVGLDELAATDLLVLALPHGRASADIERFAALAPRILDASADFRLRDGVLYERWYGTPHPNPAWLDRFVYGLPELNRERLRGANYVSGVGCNATATNLALLPLARAGLLSNATNVFVEVKVGSSEGGRSFSEASHHPERSGTVRSYAPVGHRHTAEIQAALDVESVHLSITAIEMVRGALATCQVMTDGKLTDRDVWRMFKESYGEEPFVRIVHDRTGLYRHPDPRIVSGTNHADVGWALDETTGRLVTFGAIDNLMKGAAGSAVQCMNLMLNLPETQGLDLIGVYPA